MQEIDTERSKYARNCMDCGKVTEYRICMSCLYKKLKKIQNLK